MDKLATGGWKVRVNSAAYGSGEGNVSPWIWVFEALGMARIVREHPVQRLRRAGVGSVGGTAWVAGTSLWAGTSASVMTARRTVSMTWPARSRRTARMFGWRSMGEPWEATM